MDVGVGSVIVVMLYEQCNEVGVESGKKMQKLTRDLRGRSEISGSCTGRTFKWTPLANHATPTRSCAY